MTKWKRILLLVVGLVLVAIACLVSWSYGFKQDIRAGGLTSSMATVMLANQHMDDQMTNANCEGAKQAINDYLKVIEKYKDNEDGLITKTAYYGDLMLGNIRLARIEERMGNHAQAQKHMTTAKEACGHRNWEDCSEEKLVSFTKRLEEKNPIACLGDEKQEKIMY
jgi:hypothetical protein